LVLPIWPAALAAPIAEVDEATAVGAVGEDFLDKAATVHALLAKNGRQVRRKACSAPRAAVCGARLLAGAVALALVATCGRHGL
jgi:hypothetical protein